MIGFTVTKTWIQNFLGGEKISEWINKIHCGNCLELMKRMPNDLIDFVMFSPPYRS